MKFKITEVKWVGTNLQVAFSTPDSIREVIGWCGRDAVEMAKDNNYIKAIKDILKKREIEGNKRPKVDKNVIGQEFDTNEENN